MLLLANLPLQSLHICLVALQNHLKEVRLGQLDFLDIEAHLVELLLEDNHSLLLNVLALVDIL